MWIATRSSLTGLAFTVALVAAGPQTGEAQKKPKGKPSGGPEVVVQAGIVFSVGEREQIAAFFTRHQVPDPDPLPPGIRKNLARGKPLPPGIARKVLPPDLLVALPDRPGYEVVRVGLDVLLVEVATGIVRDVLMDVIHRGGP